MDDDKKADPLAGADPNNVPKPPDKDTRQFQFFNPAAEISFEVSLDEYADLIRDPDNCESECFQLMFCAPGTERAYERDHLPAIEAPSWLLLTVEAPNLWHTREAITQRLVPRMMYSAADRAHLYMILAIDPAAGTTQQYGEAMLNFLRFFGVQATPVQRIYASYDIDAILNTAAPRLSADFIEAWRRPAIPYIMVPLVKMIRSAAPEFKREAIYRAAVMAGEYVDAGKISENEVKKYLLEAAQ